MIDEIAINNQEINEFDTFPHRFIDIEIRNNRKKIALEESNLETPFNILVVEDDKGLNRLIQKTLQKENFHTDSAFNGAEAISKVVNNQNIMLLLDFILPDTNGKRVIQALTQKKCKVPFIIMTGHGDEKIAVEMMKLGARDYIIKDRNLLNILPEVTKRVRYELTQESKLRATEKALRESEEKYSSLVEQAMDAVVIVQDEVFKFTNSAMFVLTGYKVEDLIGMPFLDLIAPDDKRLIKERNRLRIAGIKGSSFYEAKIQCKNGTIRDVELSVSDFNYNGKPASMGIIRDVTERKQVEEALRESEEMYMTLVNTSPDAVTMTGLDGNITYVSPRTIELHGFDSVDELFGKNAFDLIAPEDRKRAKENLLKTLKDGIVRNLDYTLIRKDNTEFSGELNAALIRDSFGKPKGFIATTRDITKKKQMEEDLKRYAEHLEEEVKQRTNELIQSEKMAALGQLVAGVAHEVNNPLAFLKSNMELIKKNLMKIKEGSEEKIYNLELLEQFKKQVDTSITGINRIATIIKTLKRFSRPDTGGWSLSDINQGLRDTLVMVHNQLKHRIKVIEDYGKLPNIKCNIGQLNQVFMNLILNSSQAMDKGKIWIKSWSGNRNIFIEIRDNGEGIPNDKINNIFDPFFTTKDMGTGLGLSICYRIVQDHNGDILVKSKEGKGTKITIKLPMEVRD